MYQSGKKKNSTTKLTSSEPEPEPSDHYHHHHNQSKPSPQHRTPTVPQQPSGDAPQQDTEFSKFAFGLLFGLVFGLKLAVVYFACMGLWSATGFWRESVGRAGALLLLLTLLGCAWLRLVEW